MFNNRFTCTLHFLLGEGKKKKNCTAMHRDVLLILVLLRTKLIVFIFSLSALSETFNVNYFWLCFEENFNLLLIFESWQHNKQTMINCVHSSMSIAINFSVPVYKWKNLQTIKLIIMMQMISTCRGKSLFAHNRKFMLQKSDWLQMKVIVHYFLCFVNNKFCCVV